MQTHLNHIEMKMKGENSVDIRNEFHTLVLHIYKKNNRECTRHGLFLFVYTMHHSCTCDDIYCPK